MWFAACLTVLAFSGCYTTTGAEADLDVYEAGEADLHEGQGEDPVREDVRVEDFGPEDGPADSPEDGPEDDPAEEIEFLGCPYPVAGDVDGDCLGDIVVGRRTFGSGATILFGSTGSTSLSGRTVSLSIPSNRLELCDLDNDRLWDIIGRSPTRIVFGKSLPSSGSADNVESTDFSGMIDGASALCAGDLDGDGVHDLVVSTTTINGPWVDPWRDDITTEPIMAGVLLGRAVWPPSVSEADLDATFTDESGGGPWRAANVGDVTGDGLADVGVSMIPGDGRLFIFEGSPSMRGSYTPDQAAFEIDWNGPCIPGSSGRPGSSVIPYPGAGDLDGDGVGDIILLSVDMNEYGGLRLCKAPGRPHGDGGPSIVDGVIFFDDKAMGVGDWDGDTIGDLMVLNWPVVGISYGNVFLIHGGTPWPMGGWIGEVAHHALSGTAETESVGVDATLVDDFDGDGHADLAVSSMVSADGEFSGWVYLFLWGPGGGWPETPRAASDKLVTDAYFDELASVHSFLVR